jgi:predicted O-methyltransferase YrrM
VPKIKQYLKINDILAEWIKEKGYEDSTDSRYTRITANAVEVEIAEFLYGFVKVVKPKFIIETGTHIGFATIAMAQGIKDNGGNGKIWSFDVLNQKKALENIKSANVSDFVELISGSSLEEGIKIDFPSVDILILDSVHTYKHLLTEVKLFEKFLVIGGFVLLHDTQHPKFANKVGKVSEELVSVGEYSRISFLTPQGFDILQKRPK